MNTWQGLFLLTLGAGCAGRAVAIPKPGSTPARTHAPPAAPSAAPAATATPSPARFAIEVVDVGVNHACAIGTAGQVLCWGENAARQVGSDCGATCPKPALVPLPLPAIALELTLTSSCALLRDHSVVCWGDRKPIHPVGTALAARLVNGAPESCRLDEQGALRCAGNNHLGRLGFPTRTTDPPWLDRPAPVKVPEPVSAAFIAYQFGCAATVPQHLFCWGTPLGCSGPRRVELAGKLQQLEGGQGYLCLLTDKGEVFAVSEYRERIESGCQELPFALEGPLATGARAVSCHASPQSGCSDCSGCVVREDGSVACWRGGSDGQGTLPTLEPVPGVASATQISVGRGFACAVAASGKLECWGDNRLGQLGRGATSLGETPAEPAFP